MPRGISTRRPARWRTGLRSSRCSGRLCDNSSESLPRSDHRIVAKQKMITEKESAFRILSHREGSVQPMFEAAPIGPLSPSSSLLVERRDLEPTNWQSHLLEDQLFHFFYEARRNWVFVERRSHYQYSRRPWPRRVLSSKRMAQHSLGRGDQCTFDQDAGLRISGSGT